MEIKTAYGNLSVIDTGYKKKLIDRFSNALSARNPFLIEFTEELETLLTKYKK